MTGVFKEFASLCSSHVEVRLGRSIFMSAHISMLFGEVGHVEIIAVQELGKMFAVKQKEPGMIGSLKARFISCGRAEGVFG